MGLKGKLKRKFNIKFWTEILMDSRSRMMVSASRYHKLINMLHTSINILSYRLDSACTDIS